MGEHRVPMLGSSWRRSEDPARSRDARVRAVVGALAEVDLPGPDPRFRADLRAQLVAITPRIVAESAPTTPHTRPRPTPRGSRAAEDAPARHSDSAIDRMRRLRLGRPLAVVTSLVVVFALLLGGAVWMSKKALPGDALYGVKRADESFQLATAGSDTDKAHDYLNFATIRAQEVKQLLSRTSASGSGLTAAGGVDAGTAKLIRSTLGSADSDARSASRLLGADAVRRSSGTPLDTMINWAPGQLRRLAAIAAATPDSALRARVESSARLVQAAANRALQLKPNLSCSCLGSSGSDSLGPKPCTVCTPTTPRSNTPRSNTPQPQRQTTSGSAVPPSGHPVTVPGQTGSRHVAPQPGSTSSTTAPAGAPTPPSTSGSASGGPLPTLPVPLPTPTTPPASVSSCSASVSLPILGGLGVGVCQGLHVSVGK